jgi:hypothetical protein
MYFIFTILTFITLSLTSLGVSTQIQHEGWYFFFIAVSTVTGLTSVIVLLLMVFQNMNFNNDIFYYSNNISESKLEILRIEEDLNRYKREFSNILTEMYPKYEKDIFKNMASSDARNLETILVKYPELKFDGILTTYVNGIEKRLKDVENERSNINDYYKRIKNTNDCGWKLRRSIVNIN